MKEVKNQLIKYKTLQIALEPFEDEIFTKMHSQVPSRVKSMIRHLETQLLFGFEFREAQHQTWYTIDGYRNIGLFGPEHNRTISWSDDGEQPVDEWLYRIAFPTGAYIFGQDYLTDTFGNFFEELVDFRPKYTDTTNHVLYFSAKKAKAIHEKFSEVLKRHAGLVQDERDARRLVELRKELATLEAS